MLFGPGPCRATSEIHLTEFAMSEKKPSRVLFCIGVNQNFMDGTPEEMKDVWAAFVAMMRGIPPAAGRHRPRQHGRRPDHGRPLGRLPLDHLRAGRRAGLRR